MTKEQIVKEIWGTEEEGWGLQIAVNLNADLNKITSAMGVYGQQEAVDFAEWAAHCGWMIDPDSKNSWINVINKEVVVKTTAELYKDFYDRE